MWRGSRCAGLLLAGLLGAACSTQPRPSGDFDLQGHRGARGLYPENTLEGFLETLAIGVDTLELDTGVTRDGVVVVHHDEALNPDLARDADGRWLEPPTPTLRSLRVAELARYDVGRLRPGSRTAARFPEQVGRDGVRIPTLAAVFEAADARSGGTVRFNVETKLSPLAPDDTAAPEAFADALLAVLRQHGVEPRTSVQSFDWRTLRHLARVAPDLELVCLTAEQGDGDTIQKGRAGPSPWTAGLDVDDHGGETPRLVAAAGCRTWSPYFEDLDAAALESARALGLRVVPWTANRPAEIELLLELGVDGLISDYPDRVRAAMQARGMPLPPRYPDTP